ncbi:MAG: OmpA family protein [Flavobacteriales bacterium]|nr:OmpA family protein [Flavobacteriales bacterium]
MNYRQILVAILIFCPALLFGQKNIEFNSENFPDRPAELEIALQNIQEGNHWYERGHSYLKSALHYYLDAYKLNPDNAFLNFRIGHCYLYSSAFKTKALPFLLKAKELEPNIDKEINFDLARAFHFSARFDEAIEEYKSYRPFVEQANDVELMNSLNKFIEECISGRELVKKPIRVIVENIGNTINGPDPEYGPIINADETELFFTSRRENTTGGKMDLILNDFYEDIYFTEKDDEGNWSMPINIGPPVNTSEHESAVGLSADGQKLLYFQNHYGNGDILESTLNGSSWSKPKKLNLNVNTQYHESSACYSYEGKHLYFVSNRPDENQGGRDIYVSQWLEKYEEWGPAKNLGPIVNSEYDEESVFMHPDGKTLYFSSKGHSTMGGFDIFYTTLQEDGSWTKPVNIGFPINTPGDDLFFVVAASNRKALYSSYRPNGKGEKDIYEITFLNPDPAHVTLLKGKVVDPTTGIPLGADIEVKIMETGEMVYVGKANSVTGKYLVVLPAGKNYSVTVKDSEKNHLFYSEQINLKDKKDFGMIKEDVELSKVQKGASVTLNNIFFDFNAYTLREESKIELNNIKELMDRFPKIKVEIIGHTDNVGSDEINKKMSQQRAESVADYLISIGVNKKQLRTTGMGKASPIATNDTEEGRQQNRRTEFKIIDVK